MPDLLVKLYALPPPISSLSSAVEIRRGFAAEKRLVCDWAATQFGPAWASECEAAFARLPVSCFIAIRDRVLQGFACYDATAPGFFGPTGVAKEERRRGIGSALLSAALTDMAAQGYAYAIIGATDAVAFYRKYTGAIEIPGSDPGFYRGLLK
jgi:GNAT superfamily N-acetyltransferase